MKVAYNPRNIAFGICLLLLAIAGCSKPDTKPAKVRLGNFLANSTSVTVQIYNENGVNDSIEVKYGEVTSYKTLQPGRYAFKVMAQGKIILNKTYGLGDDGRYTIDVAGLLPQEANKINKHITLARLQNITEGAAAHPANGYYPVLSLFNDYFIKEDGKGKVRVVNLLPGAVALEAIFTKEDEAVNEFSGLKYPKAAETKPFEPGSYTIKLKYKGNALAGVFNNVVVEEGKLTTFYIMPDMHNDTPIIAKTTAEP
ncbi:hypothetical protein [Flavobacterium rhizosphaerae]|uniref:DUF4397 domain-containing protein n=1 Tax=Flavobacterium rhizosphaerae TaxID=3163298 RepID=A0ABW8YVA5_9FLAO